MKPENIMLVDVKENQVITKSNFLIESKFKVTLQELRLVYWLLSNIQPEDEDFCVYRISVSQYEKFMAQFRDSNNNRVYSELKNASKKLMSRVVSIKADGGEYSMPFISRAFYHSGEGYIDIKLDDVLKVHLLKLTKEFTSIGILSAFKLNSTYSIKLLELILQYKSIGKRKLNIPDLRFMLGVDDNKYKSWPDFEKRVLAAACNDINKNTDISLSYEKIKYGRSIASIEFKFSISKGTNQNLGLPNKTITLSDMSAELEEIPEVATLMSYGVKRNVAVKIFRETPERVYEALESLKPQIDTIRNPAAWLISFINESWTSQEEAKQHVKRKVKEDEDEERDIKEYKEWKIYVNNTLNNYFKTLTELEKGILKLEFLDTLEDKRKKKEFEEKEFKAVLLFNEITLFFVNRGVLQSKDNYKIQGVLDV